MCARRATRALWLFPHTQTHGPQIEVIFSSAVKTASFCEEPRLFTLPQTSCAFFYRVATSGFLEAAALSLLPLPARLLGKEQPGRRGLEVQADGGREVV